MIEDEAKTKWCPFARPDTGYESAGPGEGTFPRGYSCIGSACMAWRLNGRFSEDGRFMHRKSRNHWQTDDAKEPSGYCGLAGAPQ